MGEKIQRIVINNYSMARIYCPFCGMRSFMFDDNLKADANVQPCKHLVFVASDFDFDYVAPEMTRFLEDKQFKMDAPEDYADGIDALTDVLIPPVFPSGQQTGIFGL